MIRTISIYLLRGLWLFLAFLHAWRLATTESQMDWLSWSLLACIAYGSIGIFFSFRGAKVVAALCGIVCTAFLILGYWLIMSLFASMPGSWTTTFIVWVGPYEFKGITATVGYLSVAGLLLVCSAALLWEEVRLWRKTSPSPAGLA